MRHTLGLWLACLCACGGPSSPEDGGSGRIDAAPLPEGCAALPAATGPTVRVTPAEAASLAQIVYDAPSGTTILLEDGTYPTGTLHFRTPGVTLRSVSDDATRVVLDGEYTANEIAFIDAANVTLAHVTLTRAYTHPVHVVPPDGTTHITGTRLYGLHIIDGAEQFVKVNPNAARTAWVDDGEVACSTFTMTDTGRTQVRNNCYTGGIDVHGGWGWHVAHNRFTGIYCQAGLAEHAVHFWNGARDTLVENNTIIDCARGIGFGLGDTGASRPYPDSPDAGVGYVGHHGGTIRNNVVVGGIAGFDTGIGLEQSRRTRMLHNTVVGTGAGHYASIDLRFANTALVEVKDNLVTRVVVRESASGDLAANVEAVPLGYFADVLAGDAHLSGTAAMAIDQGVPLVDSGLDIDGQPHDSAAPDVGADEQ